MLKITVNSKELAEIFDKLEEHSKEAEKAYFSAIAQGLSKELRDLARNSSIVPRDNDPHERQGPHLRESLTFPVTGNQYSRSITIKSKLPYAPWVARGTTSSKSEGVVFGADVYGHRFFRISHTSKNRAYITGQKLPHFRWHGQEATDYDIKLFDAAMATGKFDELVDKFFQNITW